MIVLLLIINERGAHSVTVIIKGSGPGYSNSNIEQGCVCISYSMNTLGKGMNPTNLPPVMGK